LRAALVVVWVVTPPAMILIYVIPVTAAYLAFIEVMKVIVCRLAANRAQVVSDVIDAKLN
jgi:hypothetical protein